MKYKTSLRKSKTIKSTLIFGMVFTVCAFLIIAFLCSLITLSFKNPLKIAGAFSFAVLLCTGAVSGYCTSKYKGENPILASGLCSVIFALILFGAGLIMSGGKIASICVINLISFVIITFIFAALATKKKRRKIRR